MRDPILTNNLVGHYLKERWAGIDRMRERPAACPTSVISFIGLLPKKCKERGSETPY